MTTIFAKLGLTFAAAIVCTAMFSPSAHAWRRYNPVNNRVEARRDINNNGVVGPHDRRVIAGRHLYREAYAITHRNVSNVRDFVCDSNHNGVIGPGEVRCAY